MGHVSSDHGQHIEGVHASRFVAQHSNLTYTDCHASPTDGAAFENAPGALFITFRDCHVTLPSA